MASSILDTLRIRIKKYMQIRWKKEKKKTKYTIYLHEL